jgi:beta-galactosidase
LFADHYLPPQEEYMLDLTRERPPITGGALRLGGTNPQGETLAFTNYSMTRNGHPTIPVMGEFHYSRFPHQYWEEELRKIQSGGVSIVATYLFWNHIEEEEGNFDWSGDRDIRAFIEICGLLGLEVVLRCGPFAHGECRNGGLPDWLYGRAIAVRSTNEQYLDYVRRFFKEIGKQVTGLLFKDGGPVIGLQLENEYMHAGAPWEVTYTQGSEFVPAGSDGSTHLQVLKQLAIEASLIMPIYSCTAWGGSPVPENDFLPTHAGYAFTPWVLDPLYEQVPTAEFLFLDRHAQPRIAGKIAYDTARYPYVYSELGGGIQMTYPHRPVVSPACIQALAIVALGSGTNWLGYYMYHGGSNPVGKHFYLNEYTVPRISYDFQAPLGEYGQANASYHHLRLLHLFLQECGEMLALMPVSLPENHQQLTPDHTQTARYAVRHKASSGFIFLNNYQDHVEMQNHENIRLCLKLPGETLVIPQHGGLRVHKNVSAILPFNLHLAQGVLLKYATAQFVTKLSKAQQTTYIFFAPEGMEAEFALDRTTYQAVEVTEGVHTEAHERDYFKVKPGLACQVHITALDGTSLQIFVLTQEQALTLWKIDLWGEERLLLANGLVLNKQEKLDLFWKGEKEVHLAIYPTLPPDVVSSADLHAEILEGAFSRYTLTVPERVVPLEVLPINAQTTRIRIPAHALDGLHDAFLRIDYLGDVGSLYLDGHLINDNFASELPWEIGLKRFLTPDRDRELILHISPLAQDDPKQRYLRKKIAARAATSGEELLEVFSISAIPEYHALLTQ